MNILFRTDSSFKLGLGHVMRSLVLAKRLQNEDKAFNIFFATQNLNGNINSKISEEGFIVYSLKSNKRKELIEVIKQKKVNFLVVDSYKIDSQYEKKLLKKIACKTLFFDDTFNKHYSDIVLNHGIQVKEKEYKKLITKKTKLLCGSRYTILRDEFFKSYPKTTHKDKVAIILGGNDAQNLSLNIAKLLHKIDSKYKITIITTSANKNIHFLKKEKNITLLVDIENVAEVLSKQSFIVCASGGNLFEIMALRKRFINIQVADNQASIVHFLDKKEIFTTLQMKEITKKRVKEKIEYIMKNKIYNRLTLEFSEDRLVKEIISEFT